MNGHCEERELQVERIHERSSLITPALSSSSVSPLQNIALARICHCSDHVRRSRRRGWKDVLQRMLGRYPFRCMDCGHRFYRLGRRC